MLIISFRICVVRQGDEALFSSTGLSGHTLATSLWAVTSFYGSVRHNHHARVAPGPSSPGTFLRRGCNELDRCAETPQFEAMGQWLLGVAQDLLNPELCWPNESRKLARDKVAEVVERKASWENRTGQSCVRMGSSGRRSRMTPRQRFEFLTQQVLSASNALCCIA